MFVAAVPPFVRCSLSDVRYWPFARAAPAFVAAIEAEWAAEGRFVPSRTIFSVLHNDLPMDISQFTLIDVLYYQFGLIYVD